MALKSLSRLCEKMDSLELVSALDNAKDALEVIESEKRRLRKTGHSSFNEDLLKKGKRQRKYKAVAGKGSLDEKHSDDDCCEKCVIF